MYVIRINEHSKDMYERERHRWKRKYYYHKVVARSSDTNIENQEIVEFKNEFFLNTLKILNVPYIHINYQNELEFFI